MARREWCFKDDEIPGTQKKVLPQVPRPSEKTEDRLCDAGAPHLSHLSRVMGITVMQEHFLQALFGSREIPTSRKNKRDVGRRSVQLQSLP
jgi:hypothetical protein